MFARLFATAALLALSALATDTRVTPGSFDSGRDRPCLARRYHHRPARRLSRDRPPLSHGAQRDLRSGHFGEGADLIWSGNGAGNCWRNNFALIVVPSPLPSCH